MRTERLARPAGSGVVYAGIVLLGAALFGQTTVAAEHAYPYTPSQVAEMMRSLHQLLAAGLDLIMAATLYQD